MRSSRMMLAIGMMVSSMGSAVEHSPSPILGGEVSPFAFKSKPVGNKPNKVSQKKKRQKARQIKCK